MPTWLIRIAPFFSYGISQWLKARKLAKLANARPKTPEWDRYYDEELLELQHEINSFYRDVADGGLIDLKSTKKKSKRLK